METTVPTPPAAGLTLIDGAANTTIGVSEALRPSRILIARLPVVKPAGTSIVPATFPATSVDKEFPPLATSQFTPEESQNCTVKSPDDFDGPQTVPDPEIDTGLPSAFNPGRTKPVTPDT
jgi:hypothetical protein